MSCHISANPKPSSTATSKELKKGANPKPPSAATSKEPKKGANPKPPSAATSEEPKKRVPKGTTSKQPNKRVPKAKRESKINPSEQPNKRVPKPKRESKINLCDYPFLMGQVSKEISTDNKIYKQGLIGLGEEILKGLDKKWKELEMEEAALEVRRAQLVLFESTM